jgi:hypothetical protein
MDRHEKLAMPLKVYENVVHWEKWRYSVRAWCERDEFGPDPFAHLATLTACVGEIQEPWPNNPMDIAKLLLTSLGEHGVKVNAIEVMIDNWGSLIYPDWP